MDKLKRSRTANKRVLGTYKRQIEDELGKDNPSVNALKTSLELLIKKWDTISLQCQEIQQLIPDEDTDGLLEQEIEEESEIQGEVVRLRVLLEQKLQELPLSAPPIPVPQQNLPLPVPNQQPPSGNPTPDVKLPRLELKHFNGDVFEWFGFWDSFESAIDHKTNLDPINKFTYLKSVLDGPAATVISGLPLNANSYKEAVDALKERFGRKEVIINAHMNKLLTLPTVHKLNDVKALRNLYDGSEITVRGLKSMGVASGTYGNLLCPILLNKLPEELSIEWNKRPTSATDTVEDFIKFLKLEVEGRERSLLMRPAKDQKQFQHENKSPKSKAYSSASALVASTKSQQKNVNFSPNQKKPFGCIYCDSPDHYPISCKMPLEQKIKILYNKSCCLLCLRQGHGIKDCRHPRQNCCYCKKRHHPSICENPLPGAGEALPFNANKDSKATVVLSSGSSVSNLVFLQTATVVLSGPQKERRIVALLDGGSQKSFVRKSLAEDLKLSSVAQEMLSICTFGSKSPLKAKTMSRKIFTVRGDFKEAQSVELSALEIPEICDTLYQAATDLGNCQEIKGLQMADERLLAGISTYADVDLLIGADHYWNVVVGESRMLPGGPTIISSLFGWLLHGPTEHRLNHNGSRTVSLMASADIPDGEQEEDVLNTQLAAFWELEHIGIITHEDDISMQDFHVNFEKTIVTLPDGRFQVRLPWKDIKGILPDNRKSAELRLQQLLKRLVKDPELLREYDQQIASYIAEGMISLVNSENSNPKHYLPHRPVVKSNRSTTKVRIVFDASAKEYNHPSLNDCLEQGPNLNPELLAILLRFRTKKFAFIGDIEKAFLQIEIAENDRDVVRFLWIENVEDPENSKLITLRWNRVAFGVTSSPYLLRAAIEKLLKGYEHLYPEIVRVIREGLYVDDLLSGADTLEEAWSMLKIIKTIFGSARMNMRRWISNSADLTSQAEQLEGAVAAVENPIVESQQVISNGEMSKVLGLLWKNQEDVFTFDPEPHDPVTKRTMLSAVSKIFDPLGFISPVVVSAKILIQGTWETKLGWDHPLPKDLLNKWSEFVNNLHHLRKMSVPRWLFQEVNDSTKKLELHLFSDASELAYGVAAYLRSSSGEGFYTTLLASKTRVAPLKKLTIPRLELMGAVLAVRMSEYLLAELPLNIKKIVFWMDSQVALHWIKGDSHRWKPFVKNRVDEIQKKSDRAWWRFCPGIQNPADLASRGVAADYLASCPLWWNGPEWLKENESLWPLADVASCLNPSDEDYEKIYEESKKISFAVAQINIQMKEDIVDLKRVSSFDRVVRITAWVLRFARKLIQKLPDRQSGLIGEIENYLQDEKIWPTVQMGEKTVPTLSSKEIQAAERACIRRAQLDSYPEEFELLASNLPVSRQSPLFPLQPYLDPECHVIKAAGRIEQIYRDEEKSPPILLPANHPFVEKLILQTHLRLLHSGTKTTMVQLREKYWIVRGRQQIKRILKSCVTCAKQHSRAFSEVMAPLPLDRIRQSNPFEVTGIDFAGPIYVREFVESKKTRKVYFALFTCAVTRALHLELVSDLSTASFICALRRFFGRRGICSIIYSDNAKTFTAADRELKRLLRDPKVQFYLATQQISWKFNAALAPWWGGFWERLVRTTKDLLKKSLQKTTLTVDEMRTVLVEIEAIINSRPLTYVSEDIEEGPLTPSQLLIGRRLTALPLGSHQELDLSSDRSGLLRREKHRLSLVNKWWTRWHSEHLQNLLRHNNNWR